MGELPQNQCQSGEEPYTHPRNLASGSTRKLDAGEASKRRLEFWAFELVSDHLEPESKLAQQQFLQRSGFSVVPYIFLDAGHSEQDIRDTVAGMEPKDFAYPVDGLVMEYENLRYGKSLGATGHHENRLIALKWPMNSTARVFAAWSWPRPEPVW